MAPDIFQIHADVGVHAMIPVCKLPSSYRTRRRTIALVLATRSRFEQLSQPQVLAVTSA